MEQSTVNLSNSVLEFCVILGTFSTKGNS